MAVAALVLGIVGAVFGLVPILGLVAFPLGILAVVFGFVGRRRSTGRGMALAGIITGALALVLAVVGVVIVQDAVEDIDAAFDDFDETLDEGATMEGGEEALDDEAAANFAEDPFGICTMTEDLSIDTFSRAGSLSAAGSMITDSDPQALKDAYITYQEESDAVNDVPLEDYTDEAEPMQAAANAKFEAAIAEVC